MNGNELSTYRWDSRAYLMLRQLMLEVLLRAGVPLKAHQLAEALQARYPGVDLLPRIKDVLRADMGRTFLPVTQGEQTGYWRRGNSRGRRRPRLTPTGMPLPPVPPGVRRQPPDAPRSPYRKPQRPRPEGSQG